MENLRPLRELASKELKVINGGNFLISPTVITWPIIVPFGDPSEWDQGIS